VLRLYDLVGDTDTAKDVEKWFDDVNPWDDEAEARTVGKITQAITQIGIWLQFKELKLVLL
jgi:hypothetical protein